jgi:EAL and modified HD-GYP domain-containing signal transduction protein
MSALTTDCPSEIVQVGRQPIVDRKQQTYGYELLYRHENSGPLEGFNGDFATARTVLNTFIEFGIQRLVGPHRAFINLTKSFFTDMQPLPLDKKRLVLEVLEDIELVPEVISSIKWLHESGYMIALDDYRFEPRWDPLLPFCSIIKVDTSDLDLEKFSKKINTLKSLGLILLAEKVETQETFMEALQLGFDLFQGYFFSIPQILSTRRLQSSQKLLLKMLARINDPACQIEELASLVVQDPKLSFKVLRFINSAAIGLPIEVNSIQQAVVYIGLVRLRAWASLFVMADMNQKSPEIITLGLVRAELCQSLSKELAAGEPESNYMIGLFSILDALLDQPMVELAKDMPLSNDMVQALTKRTGKFSLGLNCAIALEHGQWQESVMQLLPSFRLKSMYIEAIIKAAEIQRELN